LLKSDPTLARRPGRNLLRSCTLWKVDRANRTADIKGTHADREKLPAMLARLIAAEY